MQVMWDEMSSCEWRGMSERLDRTAPITQTPVGWATPISTIPRCRWEYLVVRTAHEQADEPYVTDVSGDARIESGLPIWQALGVLGQAEWELAAIQSIAGGWVYIFKRPLSRAA